MLFTMFKVFENAWFQQRQGTLDAEQWQAWIFTFGYTIIGRA
jgi:hypothetical protein